MEVFQNLKVYVSSEFESRFLDKLLDKVRASKWTQKSDFETVYKKNTASKDDIIICVESTDLEFETEMLRAYVWLWKKNDFFEVFNIIPVKSGRLSYRQYNFILNQFYISFIADVVKKMKLKTDFSNPSKSIENMIGKDAADALIRFSRSANKSTGNTHPYDFNRWCDFIFIIHRRKIQLSIDDFVRWLKEEEDWTDEIAWKLGLDLEYALDILKKYEQD
jgi:hypothetical protein